MILSRQQNLHAKKTYLAMLFTIYFVMELEDFVLVDSRLTKSIPRLLIALISMIDEIKFINLL